MNRYDFLYVFDVTDANPNGDPDAGNLPRLDPETGHGLVTDVCLKRKIRNYVALTMNNEPPNEIYFMDHAVLNTTHTRAYEAINEDPVGEKPKNKEEIERIRRAGAWMCKNFFDIRTFGAVMSTGVNCGQVRGPIQLSFARSIDPIITSEHAITRSSVTKEADLAKERTMGRKFTVPYAVYVAKGFVNPFFAYQTGFNEEDLGLLWKALMNAFQFDQSAARPAGSMAARKLIVFNHESELGNAPSHILFESVSISKCEGIDAPRSFADYEMRIDENAAPDGVRVENLL